MTVWEILRAEPGSLLAPSELPDDGWSPAVVPGGIGASLPDDATDADAHAWWLRRRVTTDAGPQELVLDGIGTYAQLFVDGVEVATSANAFRAQRIPLDLAPGEHVLAVRVGAFAEHAVPRKPRARWRSALLPDSSMRWRRSPHLGRIPSWQGAAPYVGVIGGLSLGPAAPHLTSVAAHLDGGDGIVEVTVAGGDAVVRIDGTTTSVVDGRATLRVPDVRPWTPHTHGEPVTYELALERDGETVETRRIGFSHIEIRDADAAPQVAVNGIPVFVRGACWVPTDAFGWVDDPDQIRRDLGRLCAAGLNAVRITGTNRYEPAPFWDIAAELGMLVWQDVMLATFDPPEDDAWLAGLEAEWRDQLGRLQGRPNVLAVCGGTETEQQPTLMGTLQPMTAIHELLPRVTAEVLPAAPHVTSSPSGGPLPTSIAQGFSHYFGVGAYLRPLDDARSANVAFASEALAFAIPPERGTVRADHPGGIDDVREQDWRDGVPSDRGVAWGFDDVTDHYVTALFGVRREDVDAERWFDLERAAVADAMTSSFAIWRSPSAPTGGAFVLSHRDLRRGPGWGLLDHRGLPKAPLLALRDTLARTALLLVDHGLDGLWLDIAHDRPLPDGAVLRLDAYASGDQPVLSFEGAAAGHERLHVESALGGFRDLTYAWRFGERYYRALTARLLDADGTVIAQTTRLLAPPSTSPTDVGLCGEVVEDTGTHVGVRVRTESLAQFVHLDAPGLAPTSGWFHLAPGQVRDIRCLRTGEPGPFVLRATNSVPVPL